MFRVSAVLALALVVCAPALASPESTRGMGELQARVEKTETDLRRDAAKHKAIAARLAVVRELRQYLSAELKKQQSLKKPDAGDDKFALAIIGYNNDLGTFMNEPDDFSQAKCAGHRVAIIHDYTPANQAPDEARLPEHTRRVLEILSLLCS